MLTLADTGLRVHEACALRRGDIDWNEGRAVIIGKGDKQAVVRFSTRSMDALKEYLSLRSSLDGGFRPPLASLPLFARHDKGAGKKIKPITTTTGRNIVTERVRQILGDESVGKITPHSFQALLCHNHSARLGKPQTCPKTCAAQRYSSHTTLCTSQR